MELCLILCCSTVNCILIIDFLKKNVCCVVVWVMVVEIGEGG